MSDQVILGFLAFLTVLVTQIVGAIVVYIQCRKNFHAINGRMQELLKITGASEHARGKLEGRGDRPSDSAIHPPR